MLGQFAHGVEDQQGQADTDCDRCALVACMHTHDAEAIPATGQATVGAVMRPIQSNSRAACRKNISNPQPTSASPHLACRAQESVINGVEPGDGVRAVGRHQTLAAAAVVPEHVWWDSGGRACRDKCERPFGVWANQDNRAYGKIRSAM